MICGSPYIARDSRRSTELNGFPATRRGITYRTLPRGKNDHVASLNLGGAIFFLKGGESMPNKQNLAAVEMLRDKLSRSQLTLVSEYRGLSVAALTDLRAALRSSNAEVIVAKNTLTKIAAGDAGITGLDEFLGGPITLTLAYGDPVAAAKALNDYPAHRT